jgi:hypothetical protein
MRKRRSADRPRKVSDFDLILPSGRVVSVRRWMAGETAGDRLLFWFAVLTIVLLWVFIYLAILSILFRVIEI